MRGYPGGVVEKGGIDPANVTQLLVFVDKPEGRSCVRHRQPPRRRRGPASRRDRSGEVLPDDRPVRPVHPQGLARQDPLRRRSGEAQGRPRRPTWRPSPARRTGTSTAAGRPGRSWRPPASSASRSSKASGGWSIPRAGSSGRTASTASTAATPSRRSPTASTSSPTCPAKDSPFGPFYGTGNWAPHGYYEGKASTRPSTSPAPTCCASTAPTGSSEFAELAHRRLRSWGMNTIANWSDAGHLSAAQDALHGHGRRPRRQADRGQRGLLGQVPRRVRPGFAEGLAPRDGRARRARSAGDPVVPRLLRRQRTELGRRDLAGRWPRSRSPADQPAKQVFVDDLKAKYETIEKLNAAWGTQHASWDALLEQPRRRPTRRRPATTWRPSTRKTAEAVLPRLPRGGQGGGPAAALSRLPLRLGERPGGPRGRQVLRRGQLQPLPAQRGRLHAARAASTCR